MTDVESSASIHAFQQFDQSASQAIADGNGAEFALWLAAMGDSPAQAEREESVNWQREIGAARARPLGYNEPHQIIAGVYASVAEVSDFKLLDALHPQPLVADSNPQRLPLELVANLDWQTRKRRDRQQQPEAKPKRRRDPAKLYDVLQQLGVEPEHTLM